MDGFFETIKDFINTNFEILSKDDKEININGILEMQNPENWTATDSNIAKIVYNINDLIKAVKQLNSKIKGE